MELPSSELTILVGRDETDGTYGLLDDAATSSLEVGSHWHEEVSEAFYLLKGTLTFPRADVVPVETVPSTTAVPSVFSTVRRFAF